MSNIQRAENLKQIVQKTAPDFIKLAQIHGAVHFEREASFAIQLIEEKDYLAQVAMSNPDSLRRAVLNVAAVGLSLSPVHGLAYLVPRDGRICLDISYRGYVHLAIEAGLILWAKAEIVHENDTYTFLGMNLMPDHEFQPFKERGDVIGAYCVAKLSSGEYMVENMSTAQIHAIRDRSASWVKNKSGPWKTDPGEMFKKTVIKRAKKSWPNARPDSRFAAAQEIESDADDTIFETTAVDVTQERTERLLGIRECLKFLGKEESNYVTYLARVVNRDIKSLEELTDIELEQQTAFVGQLVEKKKEVDNAAS
jgi:phage RecT family recombinase